MKHTLKELLPTTGTPEGRQMTREQNFKAAVVAVIERGEHPSGLRIRRELGILNHPTDGNLNGECTRWRREVLIGLGWTRQHHLRAKWKRPCTT